MSLISTLRYIASHPLNRGRSIPAIGRFAKWQVESRVRAEVEFEWIEGAKLIVKHGMTGATGNIYCGLHEFVEMAFLLHLLRPTDLFLDIGANIGSYSVLASKVCQARSIAFEPDPETAKWLRRNVAGNDLQASAVVHETALGARNGEIAFTVGLDTTNHVAASADTRVRMVRVQRLDDIPNAANPTLMKLDVEGFEEQVLLGASRVLASPSLLAVQSELCSPLVEETLESFGFKRFFYDPFKRELTLKTPGYGVSNTLFIRDVVQVTQRLAQAPLRKVFGKEI